MHNIMASEAKEKYRTIFVNSKALVLIRTNLTERGWKQVHRAIQIYNSTAVGIATKEFFQKKSKAMDMCLDWINYRIKQGQFRVL